MNIKLPVLGLSLVLAAVSCKKADFKEDTDLTTASAALINTTDTVGWKSAVQWETADQESFMVHYVAIEDAAITADVADSGLVLLFKRSGNAISALPFEEATGEGPAADAENTASKYWYHQVAEGNLLISCDAYGKTGTPDAASSFKYFVLTADKLQSLEADGYTTEKLMNLSYADASKLLSDTQ